MPAGRSATPNGEASGLVTEVLHALNGRRFDYDREVKEILKALAIDEASIDEDDVTEYLRVHTEPLAPEYGATINLWLARIEGTDQLPADHDTVDQESQEPNGYDDDTHSME